MNSRNAVGKMLGVAVLLSAWPALAQPPYGYSGEPEARRRATPVSGYGSEVAVGGGVVNFANSTARGMTDAGGSWNLRLSSGTRSFLGAEAAYIGSWQKIAAAGLDPDARLVGNGVEANLRLNIPLVSGDSLFSPFGIAGLGWSQFNVVNDDYNASGVRDRDRILSVPLGAGLAMGYRGFMFDGRYTYRRVFEQDLLGNASLDNWMVSANIGREF